MIPDTMLYYIGRCLFKVLFLKCDKAKYSLYKMFEGRYFIVYD